jgi:hypothetical protein
VPARSSFVLAGLAVAAVCAVTTPASASVPWWLSRIDVSGAQQYSRGQGVTVAVLSTGVSGGVIADVTTGPDLTGSGRGPGSDFWGVAGTADAGLIASVAPDVRFLSLRVTLEYNDPLNSNSAITSRLPAAIAAGINYAVSHGARVIDLPLDPGANGLNDAGQTTGDPAAAGGSDAEAAAVRGALSHGVVLVAPAGDNGAGQNTANYPADYPGVLAVGATTESGGVATYSSRRSDVALLAPGNALTVDSASGPITLSSTDNAAALVTGIAALIRSRYPALSPAQVSQALTTSATGATGAAASGTGGAGRAAASGGAGVANAAGALRSASLLADVRPAHPTTRSSSRRAGGGHVARKPTVVASGALAGSVIRDAVLALGAAILLLAGVLLTARARLRRNAPAGTVTWRGMLSGLSGLRKAPHGTHARRARPSSTASASSASSGRGTLSGPVIRGHGTIGGRDRPVLVPVPGTPRRSARRGESRPPWEPAPSPSGEKRDLPYTPPPPYRPPPGYEPPLPPSARPFTPQARPLPPAASPRQLPAADESFAAAPIPVDLPDWSHWNPTADTDSFRALPSDPEDDPPPYGYGHGQQ